MQSTRKSGGRGRPRNESLPASKALENNRACRQRKAERMAALEEENRVLKAENAALKRRLEDCQTALGVQGLSSLCEGPCPSQPLPPSISSQYSNSLTTLQPKSCSIDRQSLSYQPLPMPIQPAQPFMPYPVGMIQMNQFNQLYASKVSTNLRFKYR